MRRPPSAAPTARATARRRRILAVRSDGFGDVLLTEPALSALAADGDVTLLCGPDGAAAAALLDPVVDVLVFDTPWIAADPAPVDRRRVDALVDTVARGRFDLAAVFTSARQSALPTALVLRLAGVPRIGAHSEHYPGALLDVRLRDDNDVHEVERNLELTTALGFAAPADPRLRVRAPALRARLAARLPRRFVVVHPGATAPARTMDAAAWSAAALGLVRAGRTVVLTGTDADASTRRVRRQLAGATRGTGEVVDLVGQTDMVDVAGLVAAADAVCVGNTGVLHLAAAVGTPVVACFPPTVPLGRWRPWAVPHVVLGRHDVACAPCYQRTCPVPGHPCAAIDPTEVVAAVEALAPAETLRPRVRA